MRPREADCLALQRCARRPRCKHEPRQTSQPVFLPQPQSFWAPCKAPSSKKALGALQGAQKSSDLNNGIIALVPHNTMYHALAGMIGQITTILADNNLNILNMVNKSKGEIAYNVIDTDVEPSKSVEEGLSNLDGVINVRIIKND